MAASARSRPAAAAAGVASVVLGAGLGELIAALTAPASSPFGAIGAVLIGFAPPWAKETAISLFGTNDKAALLTGIAIALIVVAALAGLLQSRLPPAGRVLCLVLGAAGVAAALTRADAGNIAWAPSAVAGIVAAIAIGPLVRLVPLTRTSRTDEAADAAAPHTAASAAPESGVTATPATGATGAPATAAAPPETGSGPTPPETDSGAIPPGAIPPAPTSTPPPPDPGADPTLSSPPGPSRRRFLIATGAAAVVGILAAAGGTVLQTGARAASAVRAAIRLPKPAVAAAPVPADAELGIPGLATVITPNESFYRIDTALVVPQVSTADWELRIHGMVDNEVTLTWDELLALPLEESYTTLTCVSNVVGGDLIGTAKWLGYPLRHLLARAMPHADADMVLSTSVDGFTAGTPLEVLTDDRNAILAVGMNGEPLPVEHGFPVRMVVPGLYGYVSATKWVVDLEVTRFDKAVAYWTTEGWSERGPIKLESRIDRPRRKQDLKAGDTVIAGVAWQQHVGVSKVEVSIDEGPWREATLAAAISDDTWVQWMMPWTATKGEHFIRCRATNKDGETQTQTQAQPAPDGASGWPEILIQVY
ncbi:molybdopterin-dependent oxidoreductase [Microbacterium sp.]|uniref:molybdopterin-dependent oxidoreductase n=1 Tax=Microbacterium sp. TaxID=51671 RepID=UPI0025E96970|nr:molybdopterin-dependent oxidoreductase [Microbacterium sp.]